MTAFTDKIDSFAAKIRTNSDFIFKESCRQISSDIANATGVSTGRLLGKWSPSVNSIDNYEYKGGPSAWVKGTKNEGIANANKRAALGNLLPRIDATTKTLTTADKYYFTNNTEYIQQAEHEGWGKTGPYRMIANSIQNWALVIDSVLSRIKK